MPLIPLIIALVMAVGTGTVVSADISKPGDILYGLDQFMENVQENMPMSQSSRASFLNRLSQERAKELADLQAVDIETLNKEDQVRLEEHQEDAVNRLAASIEKLESIPDNVDFTDLEDLEEVSPEVIDSNDDIAPIIDNYNYTPPPIPSIIPLPLFSPPSSNEPPPPVDDPSDSYNPEDEPWEQGPSN